MLSYQPDIKNDVAPHALLHHGCDDVICATQCDPPDEAQCRTATAYSSQVSCAAVADAQANAARNGISNAMFQQADLDQGMPAAALGMAAVSAPDVVITGEYRPHAAAGIWQRYTT